MRRTHSNAIASVAGHAALILFSAAFALPFAWLVSTSLKPPNQIFTFPPKWIPEPVCWENYAKAVTAIPFIRYTWNTVFVALTATFATVLSSSLVAYGFGVVRWRWSKVLFLVMLATVMLPGQVTMIPVFIIFKNLGWVGNYRPLIIPAFFSSAFFVFLLMQFFRTIPRDLVDAARIDGCSHFDIYWRIVLRLSRPALVVVAFFTFTGAWNDFMGPLIYLNDDRMYTLSLGLQQFVSAHSAEWHLLMAASTIMILPIVILFFLMQKTFVEGINLSGIKG
jgi:multiple sugar transport system permease protein